MSAESAFLPILFDYHARFPRLRIVLEHLSTAAAVSAVAACGKTVAASITSHHLSLIVDNWQNDVHCNCKVSISSLIHTSSRGHFESLRRGFRGSAPILDLLIALPTNYTLPDGCEECLLTAVS